MKVVQSSNTIVAVYTEEHVPAGARVKIGDQGRAAEAGKDEFAFGTRLLPGEASLFPEPDEGMILVRMADVFVIKLAEEEEPKAGCPKCGGRVMEIGDAQSPNLRMCYGTEEDPGGCGHQWEAKDEAAD